MRSPRHIRNQEQIIKRLQTYFAILSTLLAILGCALALIVSIVAYGAPWTTVFLLVPITLVVYVLSLMLGHFIAEPLNDLISKVEAYKTGMDVSFAPDMRMREADELSEAFDEVTRKSISQKSDLARQERRQSEFVSDVAHELRTPLTAIRGNAEMLLDPDLPPELHDKFCNIIISESERLSRLSNDLLTLHRIENDEAAMVLQRINLRDLAQDVFDTLHPILEDCQANFAVVGEAPDILGNPDRMKQALTNLVANATRFIEPGGHITIELSGLHNNAVIQVKDDGTGFGDIDPKLLFGRFYRTDVSRARNTGGTGLGLAIVKSIVEAHDGTIEAVNLPEGGACFIVAIPAIAA